jgi:hypothetical protein
MRQSMATQPEQTSEVIGKYYNKKRCSIELFQHGELVMLIGKNIRSKRRCRNHEDAIYRPYEALLVGHIIQY